MINKEDPSTPQTIRLRKSHWEMLRGLMRHYGNRAWLEAAIQREFTKVFGK